MSSPSSVQCRDLNPQSLKHELSPITTRPVLPPKNFCSFLADSHIRRNRPNFGICCAQFSGNFEIGEDNQQEQGPIQQNIFCPLTSVTKCCNEKQPNFPKVVLKYPQQGLLEKLHFCNWPQINQTFGLFLQDNIQTIAFKNHPNQVTLSLTLHVPKIMARICWPLIRGNANSSTHKCSDCYRYLK